MDKENSRENEEMKTGLDLSDTQDYNVSAGNAEKSSVEVEPEYKEGSAGSGRGVFAFTAGFITCLAVLFALCYVFGLGKFLSESQNCLLAHMTIKRSSRGSHENLKIASWRS